MLSLERSTIDQVEIERGIINSNNFFNLISKNKEVFSTKEILDEIEQAEKIGAHRYLIKENDDYIGIIEYLMLNPNDQCTWLGLLIFHKDLHSKGYGTKVLNLFYEMMKVHEITSFRIGVIAENEPAHRFWMRNDFVQINTVMNDDKKTIVIYEKCLL